MPKNLIVDSPFSISLSRILRDRGEANSTIEKRGKLSNGTINKVLRSGNPTIQTAWAIEDALVLPRGSLCAPTAPPPVPAEAPEVPAPALPVEIPFPAGARPAANLKTRPVRGLAAADDSGGSRAPSTDDMDDPYWFPEQLVLVPVVGDSMSPVVLPGQYVEIDAEREGFASDGGIYVVSVLEPGPDDDYPEPIIGTFVKRCEWRENLYYLESINGDYSPFSVHVDHCRIWPVLGVWFGGKGTPPEGF